MKKLLAIVLATLSVLSFSACDNSANSSSDNRATTDSIDTIPSFTEFSNITDYDTDLIFLDGDEYFEISKKIYSEYDEQITKLTDDEQDTQADSIMENLMKKYNVPSGSTITITAKVDCSFGGTGFYLIPTDSDKVDINTGTFLYADYMNSNSLALHGEIVTVMGVLTNVSTISEPKIINHDNITYTSEKNNVSDIAYNLISAEDKNGCVVVGTVYKSNSASYAVANIPELAEFFSSQDNVTNILIISSSDDKEKMENEPSLLCFLDMSDNPVSLKAGDHIAVHAMILSDETGEPYLAPTNLFYKFID